ncbi:MAG: hypothetical protein DRR42_15080 [Gammaproteobacteria bacterium]|nr:MAG: hypothetical protein DRR42_15080 [Gammaproteobacteria bacterium]
MNATGPSNREGSHVNSFVSSIPQSVILGMLLVCAAGPLKAGGYVTSDNNVNAIMHPTGYTGTGGVLTVNVCQATTSVTGEPALAEWEQSLRNIIATYNRLQATTGNLKGLAGSGSIDFESVALHELGHCIGKSHVNLASESGLSGTDQEYTKSTKGADSTYDIAVGSDGYIGSADDVRGDDENLHWFWQENNNPFMMDYSKVDSTTYSRNPLDLPLGDAFAVNGDRTLADNLFDTPNTEAVMQQGSYSYEAQRTLTPDGVATIQYGMSGLDELEGTSDDYTINLQFATSGCDVNVQFNQFSGLAYCSYSYYSSINGDGDHRRLASATMNFDVDYNWHFNSDKPCTQTISLTQNEWKMFSLPCLVGISTGATVADILGDDLAGTYDVNWAVFERNAATDSYTQLGLTSVMETGKGYWVHSKLADQSFDVDGQYAASPDIYLSGVPSDGRWNLIGHPLDYSVNWSEVDVIDDSVIMGIGSVNTSTEMSKQIHNWNGNNYDTFDDVTEGMEGTLEAGKAYWVKAYKDGLRLRVPTLPTALTAPTDASASNGHYPDKIVLSWTDPGEGAHQFQILRYDYNSGTGWCTNGFVYDSVSGGFTTFEDASPSDPDGHCYKVRACWGGEVYPRGNGCSDWSNLTVGSVSAALLAETLQDVLVLAEEPAADGRESKLVARRVPKPHVDHRKVHENGAWYVRIIAEADGMLDRGAVLGQLADSVDGKDSHDLEKRAPFGNSYLTVLFPHEEWGDEGWGFASDYRAIGRRPSGEWLFAVYVSSEVDEVSLSFEGPEAVLEKSKLTQLGVKGKSVVRKGKDYVFTPEPGYNYFTFRVGKK